jgi:hypothetical protein
MTTMPAISNDLAAWRQLYTPVRIGPAAANTITLDDVSGPDGYRRVTAAMSRPDATRRAILLSPLHLANWAIIELLARPCFHDDTWIAARSRELGFILDPAGDIPELWLAPDVGMTTCPDPSAVGTVIGTLLAPVAEVTAACSGIHRRAVTTIAAESAVGGLHRVARSAGRVEQDDLDWLDTASAALALALGARVSADRVHARPDAGPDVVMPARSLCCVLHTKTTGHGCPGCPAMGDPAERGRSFTEWLAGMDDEEFLDVAGRPRRR